MVDTPSDSPDFGPQDSSKSPPKSAELRRPPGVLARLRALFGAKEDASLRESLGDVIEHQAGRTEFSPEERSMLMNLLEFGGVRVDDVMVPRADIVAVDENIEIAELLKIFSGAGHSRLPVYRETLDDPIGMVHVKDLVQWMVKAASGKRAPRNGTKPKTDAARKPAQKLSLQKVATERTLKAVNLMRPVLFVPPSMPASDLLVKMQATRIHMGIVVDEYGGTDGLVSIEDLVEEIVGEIVDEHDEEDKAQFTDAGNGVYVVDARAPIEDLEGLLGIPFQAEDDEDDADTLGGLVFSLVGRVPARGELVKHESGIEFEIVDADPRRIRKLKVHTRTDGTPTGGTGAGE